MGTSGLPHRVVHTLVTPLFFSKMYITEQKTQWETIENFPFSIHSMYVLWWLGVSVPAPGQGTQHCPGDVASFRSPVALSHLPEAQRTIEASSRCASPPHSHTHEPLSLATSIMLKQLKAKAISSAAINICCARLYYTHPLILCCGDKYSKPGDVEEGEGVATGMCILHVPH